MDENQAGSNALTFAVTAENPDWAPDDPRWLRQADELYDALRQRQAPGFEVAVRPAEEGEKGVAEGVIVALGSAGAFMVFGDIAREWIRERGARLIRISVNGRSLVLDAQGVTSKDLAEVAKEIIRLSGE